MPSDPVVEAGDLAAWPWVRLIDARSVDLQARDVVAATRAPVEVWEAAARAEETGFDNIAYWQNAIAGLGLDNTTPTVVFDDGRMTEAARIWFILQYFGANAFLLNGGRPALSGGHWAADSRGPDAPFRLQPGAGPVGLIDRSALKRSLGGPQILDARSALEFRGEDLRHNPRGGRLPGARLLSHERLLDDARLKSPSDLRSLFDEAGMKPGDPIVTHCDGGGRAALAAVAAVRAGFPDVRAYYLSFADWARDDSCPIESGRP